MSFVKEMDGSAVTVVISFNLLPGREDVWREAWSEVARLAAHRRACRHSRLLQDRNDVDCCAMLSEWESLVDFDRFVRETGLIWLDRVTAYSRTPPQINVFELIQHGGTREVVAEEAMVLA